MVKFKSSCKLSYFVISPFSHNYFMTLYLLKAMFYIYCLWQVKYLFTVNLKNKDLHNINKWNENLKKNARK